MNFQSKGSPKTQPRLFFERHSVRTNANSAVARFVGRVNKSPTLFLQDSAVPTLVPYTQADFGAARESHADVKVQEAGVKSLDKKTPDEVKKKKT